MISFIVNVVARAGICGFDLPAGTRTQCVLHVFVATWHCFSLFLSDNKMV